MNGYSAVSILAGVTAVMSVALGLTSVMRRRRAATRHALLTAAFAVALLLPVASAIQPYVTIQVPVPVPAVVTDAVASLDDVGASVPVDVAGTPADLAPAAQPTASISLVTAVEAIWLLGLAACLGPIVIGVSEMRSLGSRGSAWRHGRALADALAASLGVRRRLRILLHESVSGPMTYGTLRPTILMPLDAETWNDDDLRRAIVHELEHIRRADWLTQCLARTLCAAYWFNPLVWIARRQLVLEAERAADDAVLQYADASVYADQLVDLARRLSAGHRPFLAMANRRDLAARVQSLLDARQRRGRAGAWLVAGISCVAALLVIALSPMRVVARSPQTHADERPHFDVVSVRPCDPNAAAPAGSGRGSAQASPVRLRVGCRSVNELILDAYVTYADGGYAARAARPSFDIFHAGPDWSRSERFTIEATTSEETPVPVMQGPMLQTLLEDRFKLKVHRETRDVPVYEVVVAKGGAKLTPFKPGTCVLWDFSVLSQPPLESGQHRCTARTQRDSDGQMVQTVEAMTLDDWFTTDFVLLLGGTPVVNKTGITGLQTFRFVSPDTEEDRPAEIKRQLGLELRPARGPRDFLILDHVERPVPNENVTAARPFAAAQNAPRLQFEVATIKPVLPGSVRQVGLTVYPGGRLVIPTASLNSLISTAFAISPNQMIVNAPWMGTDYYSIEAKPSPEMQSRITNLRHTWFGIEDERLRAMLQALLIDRFGLKFHRETKTASVYLLEQSGKPLKLRPDEAPKPGVNGSDAYPSGFGSVGYVGGKWSMFRVSMPQLARFAYDYHLRAPVLDRTGLDGVFSYRQVEPDVDPNYTENTPSFLRMIQDVGLRLRRTDGEVEMFVVDSAQKPTVN